MNRTEPGRVHREVVSFVRRSDRMNPSQQKAWQRYASEWVVPVRTVDSQTSVAPDQVLDCEAIFGRQAPLAVEIGAGTGESVAALAAARPDWNVLAFEVFQPAVASTLSRLGREGLTHVRLVTSDAAAGLRHLIAESSITEVSTYFADPWHKSRHHKRRLVQPGFAALVASRLVPGGTWRLATDWDDYAHAQHRVLEGCSALVNRATDTTAAACPEPGCGFTGWAERASLRPITKFEAKGIAAGRTIHELAFGREASAICGGP